MSLVRTWDTYKYLIHVWQLIWDTRNHTFATPLTMASVGTSGSSFSLTTLTRSCIKSLRKFNPPSVTFEGRSFSVLFVREVAMMRCFSDWCGPWMTGSLDLSLSRQILLTDGQRGCFCAGADFTIEQYWTFSLLDVTMWKRLFTTPNMHHQRHLAIDREQNYFSLFLSYVRLYCKVWGNI